MAPATEATNAALRAFEGMLISSGGSATDRLVPFSLVASTSVTVPATPPTGMFWPDLICARRAGQRKHAAVEDSRYLQVIREAAGPGFEPGLSDSELRLASSGTY